MPNEGAMYRLDRRDRYEVDGSRGAGRSEAAQHADIETDGGYDADRVRLYLSGRRDRYEQDEVGARPGAPEPRLRGQPYLLAPLTGKRIRTRAPSSERNRSSAR